MQTKVLESTLIPVIANELAAMNYELVRVQLTPGGRYLTLQVMAERTDRKPMTVNDCVQISGTLSPRIDQSGLLAGEYTLEVSSPGVERPLVKIDDYKRFAGQTARIELAAPIDNGAGSQRRFQGKIVRVTGNAPDAEIEIKTEVGDVRLPVKSITKGKLVMTDNEQKTKDNTKH